MKNTYQIRDGVDPKYPFPSYACCSARSSTHFNGPPPAKKNRYHPSHCCSLDGPLVRLCKWTPVLFVTIILTWSYYAYIIQFCWLTLPQTLPRHSMRMLPPIAIAYIVIFNLLFGMLVWSYLTVAYNRFGRHLGPKILARFRLRDSDMAHLEGARNENDIRRVLDGFMAQITPAPALATVEGGPRYCDACKLIKPDRAHHCAACGRCVFKMDHHCPWVNNCIQYGNYKQFILFLLYGLLLCCFAAATTFPYFVSFWSTTTASKSFTGTSGRSQDLILGNSSLLSRSGDDGSLASAFFSTRFHVIFLFFVSIMFGISMGALLTYHCYLVSRNRTTLESFRAPIFLSYSNRPDKNGFDLGSRAANFQQVFGPRPLYWPLPIFSGLGDGTYYPTRHDHNGTTVVIPNFGRGNGCPPIIGQTSNQRPNSLENWHNVPPSVDPRSPSNRGVTLETQLLNDGNNRHNFNHTPETTSQTNLLTSTQSSTFIEIPMLSLSNETLPIKHPQPCNISPYGSFSTSRQAPINMELYAPS